MVVVLDNGAGSAKIGYSTDAEPRFVIPTHSPYTPDVYLSVRLGKFLIFCTNVVFDNLDLRFFFNEN